MRSQSTISSHSATQSLLWDDRNFAELDGELERTGTGAWVTGGSFSDIWKGIWIPPNGKPIPVAIKCLRITQNFDEPELIAARTILNLNRIKREILIWKNARHKYILPLLGWRSAEFDPPEPCIVTPWCQRGHLARYCQETNPSTVSRLNWLLHAAEGIEFMHTQTPPLVHGDIKAENVLITDNDQVAWCDFGLARATQECVTGLTTRGGHGTAGFIAPEIFFEEDAKVTSSSDIYALGGLIIQVLSDTIPFYGWSDGSIILFFAQERPYPRDLHPMIPNNATVWGIIERCQMMAPADRASISVVIGELRQELAHCQGSGVLRTVVSPSSPSHVDE
ncbi:hypothetical protein FRB94_000238 [Tulasnella sp. JGI-2019a]|nr:hypothetical protein FRB94_000238 [Tulasnella sp. JGI-2019a]KAG9015304.1 hypothetical protein FRB93_013004 [Tulasnella sp. JGI-2019a]